MAFPCACFRLVDAVGKVVLDCAMFLLNVKRYIPLAVWLVAVSVILFIPFKIISYGFLPMDDALRHAAKTIAGKSWSEIIVIKENFPMDPSPGWQKILEVVHGAMGGGAEALVVFSVVALMLVLLLSGLPWLKRPEAWLAALFILTIFDPACTTRFARGRPYVLTDAILIAILFLWSRSDKDWPRKTVLTATTLLVAATAWIHGSWYLMCVPGAAILLACGWRWAFAYGGCWLVGGILGAACTGHPFEFLGQDIRHLFGALGNHAATRQLVPELHPSDGNTGVVLVAGLLILWRAVSPGWNPRQLLNPLFMLAVIGWLLGLKINRFWWDWGMPAFLGWVAWELQAQFDRNLPVDSVKRLLITLGLALGLFLGFTSDRDNRWTANLTTEYVTPETPDINGWLPGPGGIVYNSSMDVFFQTFFKNPTADWRYVHGFEPGLMRPEDLEVLRHIQWTYGDARAYEPWVKKMRPEDRLFISGSSGAMPNIPQLEWKYAVSGLWIGRLPQSPANADEHAR